MLEPSSPIVVADTSVLVNFLRIDRMDLIANLPHEFLATEHVAEEISNGYKDQMACYEEAINNNVLSQVSLDSEVELETFAELSASERIGYGECSVIACAICRQHALAIDDRRATAEAKQLDKGLPIVGTADLIVAMIKEAILTLEQADAIKSDWSINHRFTLKLKSFSELL